MKQMNTFYTALSTSVLAVGLMILIFGIPCGQSFVLTDTRDADAELDLTSTEYETNPEGANGFFKDISMQQLSEDDALVKTIVLDATGSDQPSQDLLKETEAEFLSTVLRLVGNGEMYKDARIDAITAALQSAFLATMGTVDHKYLEQVLMMIREKDEQRRRQNEEHEANNLGISISDSYVEDSVKDASFRTTTYTSTIPPTRGWRNRE